MDLLNFIDLKEQVSVLIELSIGILILFLKSLVFSFQSWFNECSHDRKQEYSQVVQSDMLSILTSKNSPYFEYHVLVSHHGITWELSLIDEAQSEEEFFQDHII